MIFLWTVMEFDLGILESILNLHFTDGLCYPPKNVVRQIQNRREILLYDDKWRSDAQNAAMLARAYFQTDQYKNAIQQTKNALYFKKLEEEIISILEFPLKRGLNNLTFSEPMQYKYKKAQQRANDWANKQLFS